MAVVFVFSKTYFKVYTDFIAYKPCTSFFVRVIFFKSKHAGYQINSNNQSNEKSHSAENFYVFYKFPKEVHNVNGNCLLINYQSRNYFIEFLYI